MYINGFIAGTLVHTKNGLVPIQEIKVNDLILTATGSDFQKKSFKKVLEINKSENVEDVFKLEYINDSVHNSKMTAYTLGYTFCSKNQLFWQYSKFNSKGQWFKANELKRGHFVSIIGDELILESYKQLTPVRRLPNFPENCAYFQNLYDKDYDTKESLGGIEFIEINEHDYKFICLSEDTSYEEIMDFKSEFGSEISDANLFLNDKTHIKADRELFITLLVRMWLDQESDFRTIEDAWDDFSRDLFINYGSIEGLNHKSIHFGRKKNPFRAHFYSLVIEENNNFFICKDGLLVRGEQT